MLYTNNDKIIINPRGAGAARMRTEGYGSRRSVSVCPFVSHYSRTTGYEAAYEQYQQLQCYKGMKTNLAILLKRLLWRDMA